MIELGTLDKKQLALIVTCNIFEQTYMTDDIIGIPIEKYYEASPDVTWGQYLTHTEGTPTVPIDPKMDKEDKKKLELLNEFIIHDSTHHHKHVIFDTFLKWVYKVLYDEYPAMLYSDEYSVTNTNEYEVKKDKNITIVNRGQCAFAYLVSYIHGVRKGFIPLLHSDILVMVSALFRDFKTYENEYTQFYEDFISLTLGATFKESSDEVINYLGDTLEDIINKGDESILVFDILYEYFKEVYHLETAQRIARNELN